MGLWRLRYITTDDYNYSSISFEQLLSKLILGNRTYFLRVHMEAQDLYFRLFCSEQQVQSWPKVSFDQEFCPWCRSWSTGFFSAKGLTLCTHRRMPYKETEKSRTSKVLPGIIASKSVSNSVKKVPKRDQKRNWPTREWYTHVHFGALQYYNSDREDMKSLANGSANT